MNKKSVNKSDDIKEKNDKFKEIAPERQKNCR